jgi:hypothetical protein
MAEFDDPEKVFDTTDSEPLNSIDKLTLELLINKSQYKKYIKKTDSSKYSENQIYLGKIERYRNKLENMFSRLIENPETQITSDIDRDFTHFVKTCIQYFELNEMENVTNYYNGDPIDDESMFGVIDNNTTSPIESSSIWGNKINKIDSSFYMPKYTMDSYVRSKKS